MRAFKRTGAIFTAVSVFLLYACVSALPSKTVENRHFLWKVSSPGSTIYLCGSVHLLKEGDYPLDPSLENAFANSSRLFFEINLDTIDKQQLQQLTMAKGVYGSGQTLQGSLSSQTYELVKKRFVRLGLPGEQFERFKPWLLAILFETFELHKLGFDPNRGVDKYFYEKAKTSGKHVDGFEGAEYQINLLSNMPAAMQEALLLETMKNLDDLQSEMATLVEKWKTGDADALDALLFKSYKDYPEAYTLLIVDRNKNWLPKIEALATGKENVFIVVGAAHLVGKDGLIALLKQKGYQVEQL
jgi:uncharacterized protein YbaP (TraB family)